MRNLKYPLLLKTYKVKCPICKERREVIQRYKALKLVRCEDCKMKHLRDYQRERARNARKTR